MAVLSIDTAFAACMVGVIRNPLPLGGGGYAVRTVPMERGQAESLVPMIQDVLKDANLTFADLTLIVVNVGPGSFTGVRVGIATARGIALACNIPVQGVVSTDALYVASAIKGTARVMIDSRRDDYFSVDYDTPDDIPVTPSRIRIITADRPESRVIQAGHAKVNSHAVLVYDDDAMEMVDYSVMLAQLGARLYSDASYPLRGIADPLYLRDAEVTTAKK